MTFTEKMGKINKTFEEEQYIKELQRKEEKYDTMCDKLIWKARECQHKLKEFPTGPCRDFSEVQKIESQRLLAEVEIIFDIMDEETEELFQQKYVKKLDKETNG